MDAGPGAEAVRASGAAAVSDTGFRDLGKTASAGGAASAADDAAFGAGAAFVAAIVVAGVEVVAATAIALAAGFVMGGEDLALPVSVARSDSAAVGIAEGWVGLVLAATGAGDAAVAAAWGKVSRAA